MSTNRERTLGLLEELKEAMAELNELLDGWGDRMEKNLCSTQKEAA